MCVQRIWPPRYAFMLPSNNRTDGNMLREGEREGKLRLGVFVGMCFGGGISIMNLVVHSRPSG